jgi:hypothetical protein
MFAGRKVPNLQDALALLNCRRLPGRLNTAETAVLLGFQEHDIPALVAGKLLTPLGKPATNAPKYFAAVDVLNATQDREWLSQATRMLSRYWSEKNGRKRSGATHEAMA